MLLSVVLVLVLLIVAASMLLMSSAQTIIVLTPRSEEAHQTVSVIATNGTPSSGQVETRRLSVSETQTQHAPTSGTTHVPQLVAHGSITFYNLALTTQTVSPYTILTSSNGVQVETLQQAVVPPATAGSSIVMGQATVPAQATQAGAIGNMPIHAISVSCCSPNGSITARNEQAFTGGQDTASALIVEQRDVDRASAALQQQAMEHATATLASQVAPGERVFGAPEHCITQTVATPPVGAASATVTVAVTVTCREDVYQDREARRLASQRFITGTQKALGEPYTLRGGIQFGSVQVQAGRGDGTLLIRIPVRGTWIYTFSQVALQHLKDHLIGKSWKEANTFLRQQAGVADVTLIGNAAQPFPSTIIIHLR